MQGQAQSIDEGPEAPPPSMARWVGRVALVTGVGNSTGSAVAKALARNGMNVVGVDDGLDFDNVENITDDLKSEGAPGSLFLMKCDIKSVEKIKKLFINVRMDPDLEGVDVCVHCGICALGESILGGNPDAWKDMLDTNVLGAALVSQETVKSMRDRELDDGHIIFMNGMLSHRLVPGNKVLHFLAATKFAARGLLEGLRYELRQDDSQIRVSAISAGVIETDIVQKLFNNDVDQAKNFMSEKRYLDVENIANTVLFILGQPPHVQIHDILMRSTDQIP